MGASMLTTLQRLRLRAPWLGATSAAIALACLAPVPPALGAEGGPGLNTVPAAGGTAAPPATVTAAKPLASTPTTVPATATTAPAGQTTAPPATGLAGAPSGSAVPAQPGASQTLGTIVLRRQPSHAGGTSGAAIALALAAALVALCAAAWAVARMTAWEPRWTLSLRHSMAEAGHRASATWAELGDWIRLGR
jgi:hypothetical protein